MDSHYFILFNQLDLSKCWLYLQPYPHLVCLFYPLIVTMSMEALRPTFFELYAAEQLSSALRPALRFALDVLSVRYASFTRLAERSDEVFTTISFALELTSLRRDSATLSEAFYSLRRVSLETTNRTTLPPRTVLSGLLWSVIAPYMRLKLDQTFVSMRAQQRTSNPHRIRRVTFDRQGALISFTARASAALYAVLHRIHHVIRRAFLSHYALFTALTDGAALMAKLLYVLELSPYFSPALIVQRLKLRRLTAAELVGLGTSTKPRGILGRTMHGADTFVTALKYAFFAALLAFRFLEYYQAAEDEAPSERASILPPPQPLLRAHHASVKLPTRNDICALCEQQRTNPSALIVSGYVFCHMCIARYVADHGKCPITLLSANHRDIRRVYPGGAYVHQRQ